ncbi:DUF4124 domain-containing protein [Hydrogenophaga pseudoflava]|uniref:DUF4124 domain-containing protein n=1 Tax=Hydrogenophaga pseudoflava TaxID=47421 RepID=UPI0027E3DCC1|nr:DUF4124 domain-containing protein [Hydrogenophaga pseudoflava]MDQ7746385.1 DUF4124 domain-containing protein [Hydrogenophaga pseudoflava]
MPSRHTFPAYCRALAFASFAVLFSGSALAQWVWVDASGNKVFSDTAPPPGTPEKSILRKPGSSRQAAPASPAPTGTDSAGAQSVDAPKVTGRDEQLEAKKKQAEKQAQEAAQAKKKAEDDRLAAARAGNCERARRAKATMDSGVRIATTNAKGEREIMDDKARAAEVQRIEGVIRSDCAPASVSN